VGQRLSRRVLGRRGAGRARRRVVVVRLAGARDKSPGRCDQPNPARQSAPPEPGVLVGRGYWRRIHAGAFQ
jgi:hypothetical protein